MITVKKSIKWIILSLLVIVTFFSLEYFFTQKVIESSVDVEQEENNDLSETTSSSIYPGVNVEIKIEEKDLYTLSISKPYTEFNNINNPIEAWLNEQSEAFLSEIDEVKDTLEKNEFRAHLNIQSKVEQLAKDMYGVTFESYQITGANGQTKIKTFVIDLKQTEILQVDQVFNLDKQSIKSIKKIISTEAKENKDINKYVFEEHLDKAIEQPQQWKWLINDKHVSFFFDEYEIASGAAGPIKLDINNDKLKQFLNEDFAKVIDIEIPKKKKEKKKPTETVDKKLDSDGKYIALTFDDGPHIDVTPRVLETLKKHSVPATFFMLGSQVEYYPDLAVEVAHEGHEVGNHTMNHQDLTILGLSGIETEIAESNQTIEDIIGLRPKTLRPPYGATNDSVKQAAINFDTSIVMWSVDSLDWQSRNATKIYNEVMQHAVPGSIVLLHDIHPETADALPELITALKEDGYELVTVSQLLELNDEKGIGPHYGNYNE